MRPYQILLDTNILVSGLRSRRGASYLLLSRLNDPRWQLNVSVALVLEYEATLKREPSQLGLSKRQIEQVVDTVCGLARQHTIFYLWRPLAQDPADDFLLDLAVAAQADFIISYNKRHLYQAEHLGILVLTPKEFLIKLGDISG